MLAEGAVEQRISYAVLVVNQYVIDICYVLAIFRIMNRVYNAVHVMRICQTLVFIEMKNCTVELTMKGMEKHNN